VQTERDLWANAATYVVRGVDLGVIGRTAIKTAVTTGTVINPEIAKEAATKGTVLNAEIKQSVDDRLYRFLFPAAGAAAVAYFFLRKK